MPEGISLSHFIGMSTDSRITLFRQDIQAGDIVYVKTQNSTYSLYAREDGVFEITGGWFDKRGVSPFITKINGCTYGGSMINIRTIAVCGLCIEFGNNVRTSTVQKIFVNRYFKHN